MEQLFRWKREYRRVGIPNLKEYMEMRYLEQSDQVFSYYERRKSEDYLI